VKILENSSKVCQKEQAKSAEVSKTYQVKVGNFPLLGENKVKKSKANQNITKQNRAKYNKTKQNRRKQNKAKQDQRKQNKAK
jgi:hypothetical protein